MTRFIGLASILLLSAFQIGCCCSPCGKSMGCGRTYWGAYADDPPTCEPCDNCGNWTGGNRQSCKPCNNEGNCDFNWARGKRVSLFAGLFNCDLLDGNGKSSCTEPSCGEPSCGEPDCGCGHGSSLDTAASAPWPSQQTSNVSFRTASRGSSGCNCGKQH